MQKKSTKNNSLHCYYMQTINFLQIFVAYFSNELNAMFIITNQSYYYGLCFDLWRYIYSNIIGEVILYLIVKGMHFLMFATCNNIHTIGGCPIWIRYILYFKELQWWLLIFGNQKFPRITNNTNVQTNLDPTKSWCIKQKSSNFKILWKLSQISKALWKFTSSLWSTLYYAF